MGEIREVGGLSSVEGREKPAGAWLRWAALGGVFLACAACLAQMQLSFTNRSPWTHNTFERYMWDGAMGDITDARLLARWIVVGAHAFFRETLTYREVNMAVQVLAAWVGLGLVYGLARRYMRPGGALAAPFLMCAFVPWGFFEMGYGQSYPYDLLSLAFCAGGLLCAVRERFGWLCVVLGVGMLNKETVVWVAFAYGFLQMRRMRPGSLAWRMALLLGICTAAYCLPRGLFWEGRRVVTAAPFDGDRARWAGNLEALLFLGRGADLQQNVYWPLLGLHLVPVALARRLHPDLRRLYWGVPFFLLPTLLLGNVWEVRQLNDIMALGAVSCVFVLGRILEGEPTPGQRAATSPPVG